MGNVGAFFFMSGLLRFMSGLLRFIYLQENSCCLVNFCMCFDKCIQLRNLHHNQDTQQFLHPPKFPWALFRQLLHSSRPLTNTDLFPVPLVLPFAECHIPGIIQCVSFKEKSFIEINSHTIQFIHVKCIIQWFWSIFTKLCNYHHN